MNRISKLIALLTALVLVFALAACKKAAPQEQELSEEEKSSIVASVEDQQQNILDDATKLSEELLDTFAGDMDLEGEWQDEVSQRATMDVTQDKDGTVKLVVHWASSATEASIWEITGTWDADGGILSYDNGKYYVLTVDEDGKDTVSGKKTTKGAFLKEGKKLRWQDSLNEDDAVFVKPE